MAPTQRNFSEWTNKNGGVVTAHVVTDDTQGTVRLTDGRTHEARSGEVLIMGYRVDEYEIGAGDFFENYTQNGSADSNAEPAAFDPSAENADAVREYLNKVRREGDTEEFDRVVTAEKEGKNRSSAIPV